MEPKKRWKAGPGRPANKAPGTMTQHEAALIINRAMGKSLAESAIAAGYDCRDRSSASSIAVNVLRRHLSPDSEFAQILRDHGVNTEALASKFRELMDATLRVRIGPDDSVEVADGKIQLKVCALLTRLLGLELPKTIVTDSVPSFEERLVRLTGTVDE